MIMTLFIIIDDEKGKKYLTYENSGWHHLKILSKMLKYAQTAMFGQKMYKEEIDPKVGIQAYQARKIAFNLGLSGKALKEMVKFVIALYSAYEASDASIFEINPVFKTSDDLIFAADAKVNIDDNALYRHKEYEEMRDISEEDPNELEAGKYNLNFVKLDGNVGCMVNGAGLAMATMDIIKLSGGDPANFLDVGGTANAETVEAGFRIILKDKRKIVVNKKIFFNQKIIMYLCSLFHLIVYQTNICSHTNKTSCWSHKTISVFTNSFYVKLIAYRLILYDLCMKI